MRKINVVKKVSGDYVPKKMVAEARGAVVGFRSFINNYGVAPLAVAVVVGGAVNELVRALVDGLIYPLISLISSQGKLQGFQFVFHGATFKVGSVINSAISFLVICAVVYFFVKYILRDEKILNK